MESSWPIKAKSCTYFEEEVKKTKSIEFQINPKTIPYSVERALFIHIDFQMDNSMDSTYIL